MMLGIRPQKKHVLFFGVFAMLVLGALWLRVSTDLQKTVAVPGTETWVWFDSEACGIAFRHPKDMAFTATDCSLTANVEPEEYYSFTVIAKEDAQRAIDGMAINTFYGTNNLHASNTSRFQNGVFVQSDGLGTGGYYFVNDYFVGKEQGYYFMTSRPTFDADKLALYQALLATVRLTK